LKEPFPFVFGLFVVEFVTAVSGFEIGGLVEVWFIFFFDFMNFWSLLLSSLSFNHLSYCHTFGFFPYQLMNTGTGARFFF
jgi:hypothetical protein